LSPAKDNRKTIRVVLAEDQGMVLGALATLLEIEGDISVVGRALDGQEALDAVLAQNPDVFITDIEMPRMTGVEAAQNAHARGDRDNVCAGGIFAEGAGCGSVGVLAEGSSRGGAGRCGAARASGIAGCGSRVGN
jgi:Response regulator receiver domain